jgi:uncharacterized RDD family membrane protein YckC
LEMTMIEHKIEYVGFWARVGASLVDTICLLLITVPPLWLISRWTQSDVANITAELLLYWVAPALIVIALWLRKQATPGKMVISARVVDAATGEPLTARQALIRYLGYFVSAMPLCMGVVWVAFDSKKQGWHDKLARTVVVRAQP